MFRITEEQKQTLISLCMNHQINQMVLFGSALRDTYDPATSDLDFLIRFKPLPPVEHGEHYFALKEALEKLFNSSVDLVEEDVVDNPYLMESINQNKLVLYAA